MFKYADQTHDIAAENARLKAEKAALLAKLHQANGMMEKAAKRIEKLAPGSANHDCP